jgi:hypothetical protein
MTAKLTSSARTAFVVERYSLELATVTGGVSGMTSTLSVAV